MMFRASDLIKTIIVASTYYVTGTLSLLLAIPPGFATPVWPAAGIALAATLLWGYRCLPGVFLGSLATNLLIAAQSGANIFSFLPILIAGGIAVGAVAQATIGAYLVKRACTIPNTLQIRNDIFALLLRGGVIACLTNSLIGPLVLWFAGIIPAQIYWVSVFTWWVGDVIGVALFTPMLLLLSHTSVSYQRKVLVTLPILLFAAIAVFIFLNAQENQLNKKQQIQDVIARDIGIELENALKIHLNTLTAVARFITASDKLSHAGFTTFANGFLNKNSALYALSWNPKVTDAQRQAFAQSIRHQGFPDFLIKDQYELDQSTPASIRDVYFPTTYLAPYKNNQKMHGYDIYNPSKANDTIKRLLDYAKHTGQSIIGETMTTPLSDNQDSLFIYHPVYSKTANNDSSQSRHIHLIGYTAAGLKITNILTQTINSANQAGLDIILHHRDALKNKHLLYDSRTPDHRTANTPISIPNHALQSSTRFIIANHEWELHFIQKPSAIVADQGWGLWYTLIAGLLFSAIFGILLLSISANTEAIQKEIEIFSPKSTLNSRTPASIAIVCGILVIALGLVVLLGWHIHSKTLIQVHSSFAPMQYNTALGFLFSGIGSIALAWKKVRLNLICGVLLVALGNITLCQYIFSIQLGIDQLFMQHYITTKTSHPGRMAPNTALCFFLFGAILLGHSLLRNAMSRTLCLRILGSSVLLLGTVAFIGYLANLETAYSWLNLTRMAVHTAAGFMVLGVGIITYSWQDKISSQKSNSALWFSSLAAAIVMLFSIALWQQFKIQQQTLTQTIINDNMNLVTRSLSEQINSAVIALRRMAQRWELHGGTAQFEWSQDAKHYVNDFAALTTVEWVDSSYHVRWIEPIAGNEKALGLNIAFNQERKNALKGAAEKNKITLTPPIDLVQGYRAFITYVPIHINERFDGFMVGIYNTDIFLNNIFSAEQIDLLNIRISDEEKIIFQNAETDAFERGLINQKTLNLFNRNWAISASAKDALLSKHQSSLPEITLLAGILFSLLSLIAVYTSIISNQRSKLLQQKSQVLKENQEKLKAVSEKLGLILDNAGEGIYGLDLNGHTTFANNAAIEMLGYTLEEMVDKPQHNLIHHHYPDGTEYPRDKCNIYQALKTGKTHTEDKEVFWKKDGTALPVEYTSKPIINEHGKISGAVVVFRDITERKQIEKMKDEFISTVNHELRTPLTSIQGSLGLLRAKAANSLDAKGQRLLDLSYDNCKGLAHLVNDILDMEKIAAGKMLYQLEKTEMCQLVEDIVERHSSFAEQYKIQFEVHKEVEIAYCTVDTHRFSQALANLLSNAVKFSPEGEIVTISIMVLSAQQLRISVSDHGPGIPQPFQDKIFGKFAQADASSTRSKGGTGLGLNITKSIIEAFHGDIAFDTKEGEGSTFYFTLPLTTKNSFSN